MNLDNPVSRRLFAAETTQHQMIDSDGHETRKRSRVGNLEPQISTLFDSTPYTCGANSLRLSHLTDSSPAPLANDRYNLAGGMERAERFAKEHGDSDDYFQLGKQRGMWSRPVSPTARITSEIPVDMMQTPNGRKPWMLNQIMSIFGGVAGTLFSFCSVSFRGFKAGGGQAYTIDSQGDIAAKLGLEDKAVDEEFAGPVQKTFTGYCPENDYGVLSVASLENERPRMTKRQRTGDSWVMVDREGCMDSRPASPRLSERRIPGSPSHIPRPISRIGPSTPAQKRPSLIPISRRTTMDRQAPHSPTKTPSKPYSKPRCYSRQSYGSPVMFENEASKNKSPLPADSQRLINKMRREELEDEARMRRMSSQMSIMLREAREALGSRFEVEDN